jgi:hypothetical protein
MKYIIKAFVSILAIVMLASSAMACHWCDNAYPTIGGADIKVVRGQQITFNPDDPDATYTWKVFDTNGHQIGTSVTTSSDGNFVWTVPTVDHCAPAIFGYYITWRGVRGSVDTLECIKEGCINVWLLSLPDCPVQGPYCEGTTPSPSSYTVTIPATVPPMTLTYSWKIDTAEVSTTNTLTSAQASWNTILAGDHNLKFTATNGAGNIIKDCTDPFTVYPKVVGGVAWS